MATAVDPDQLAIPDDLVQKFVKYGLPWTIIGKRIKEFLDSEKDSVEDLERITGIPCKTIQNYSTGGTFGWGASDIPLFRLLILDYYIEGNLFAKYFPRLFDYLPAQPLPESGELNRSVLDEAIPAVKGIVEIMETAQSKGLDTMSTQELLDLLQQIDPGILDLIVNMKAEVVAEIDKREEQAKVLG